MVHTSHAPHQPILVFWSAVTQRPRETNVPKVGSEQQFPSGSESLSSVPILLRGSKKANPCGRRGENFFGSPPQENKMGGGSNYESNTEIGF